ncbi:hypothetical protein MKX01_016618 [Papaver californicum]|nr:hypothetical protein MKX01_016618 [Papaver californicum]
MPAPPEKTITLKSSDEQTFDIEETIVLQSQTLTAVVANYNVNTTNIVIPLDNVRGNILTKIKNWDAEFENVDAKVLRELMRPASFLNIYDLVDLMLWKMADMMQGKTLEEILILFPGIFTERVVEEEDYGENQYDLE